MLAGGYGPVGAIDMIRAGRPIANVGYAEDALGWFRMSRDIAADQRRIEWAELQPWRAENPHDTVRIIRRIRLGEDPIVAWAPTGRPPPRLSCAGVSGSTIGLWESVASAEALEFALLQLFGLIFGEPPALAHLCVRSCLRPVPC
jgi:hypothetical protein